MEQKIVKPKTQRHGRFLKAREPKVHENDKTALFIKGGNASQEVTKILKELYMMKKPNAIMFNKRNVMRPFEDHTSIEFLAQKNDSSLFMFGSHSKKRPNNLVVGRCFNYNLLDMMELGVVDFKSMADFKAAKQATGSKPCLVFSGNGFDIDFHLMRLKSLLIDFFRGPVVDNVQLSGLESVIQFTAADDKVLMRCYSISLKNTGSSTPRVELEEQGPRMDMVLRRSHLASDQLYKQACRKPKAVTINKTKNIEHDILGTKRGRVHMTKQDLNKLQTRKTKALKRRRASSAGAGVSGDEEAGSPPSKMELVDEAGGAGEE